MSYYPNITYGVYNPPVAHYSHVALSDAEIEHMKKIIGYAGKNFKWISNISQAKYIWYNEKTKVIEVWGPMSTHVTARSMLRDLVDRVVKKGSTQAEPTPQEPPGSDTCPSHEADP